MVNPTTRGSLDALNSMVANETSELSAGLLSPLDSPTSTRIFPETAFFIEQRASALPSPAEIRALNTKSGHPYAEKFNRPPPVVIPSLRLFVKYGADVTVSEAKTQAWIRELLGDKVPIPEVFGWAEDGEQTFIYMSLVEGYTLRERWGSISEHDRQAICHELRGMVNTWRALLQDKSNPYIGNLGKQQLNDIFIRDRPELKGPYLEADAVQRFHERCDIEICNDFPIVFTHNDLCPPNILLSPGPKPKVTAIIDWGQSGWYPSYWEYCKGRRVHFQSDDFNSGMQEEWHTKYLPMVLDPMDDEIYHAFIYFQLANI